MLMKILSPAILILFAIELHGVAHAADMKIDCRLKGGSVVQLSAGACGIEGGSPANEAPPLAPAAMPVPVDGGVAGEQPLVDSKLAAAQRAIVDLLGKPVVDTTPLIQKPEGIERTSRFDGCRLMVDEIMHIDLGNLFSQRKSFKISSVIDLQKIGQDEFGILGEINSKGGDLKGVAVYFEQRKKGANMSISVLQPKNGGLEKYRTHSLSAYWSAPRYDLWIADEYGYPKETVSGNAATDKVRILLIVNSADDAEKLKNALEDVRAMCKVQ